MPITVTTRSGIPVSVPLNTSEDPVPKFCLPAEASLAKTYYEREGYVVIRSAISRSSCSLLRRAWQSDLKHRNPIVFRQTTGVPEKNILNHNGWIMNPVLNPHSLSSSRFKLIRSTFNTEIFSSTTLSSFCSEVLGDAPKVVQSMFFEGNTATQEHQDSYYLDDSSIGTMVAVWIALENISPTSGRFFVAPRSHLVDLSPDLSLSNNIAVAHTSYISKVQTYLHESRIPLHAPALEAGDCLLWNSLTIHGSLTSYDPQTSRSSITLHVIRNSSDLLVHRSLSRIVPAELAKCFHVYRPKDQDRLFNRIELLVSYYFTPLYLLVKKSVILLSNLFSKL